MTTAMMIDADNNMQIPKKTRNRDFSEPANGEVMIEEKHKKHSTTHPPNKPVIKGVIKGMILFIRLSLHHYKNTHIIS